jgi:hypothetical protein
MSTPTFAITTGVVASLVTAHPASGVPPCGLRLTLIQQVGPTGGPR